MKSQNICIENNIINKQAAKDDYSISKASFTIHYNFETTYISTNDILKIPFNFILVVDYFTSLGISSESIADSYVVVKGESFNTFLPTHTKQKENLLYTPSTLIDSDYPKDEIFFYLVNYSNYGFLLVEKDIYSVHIEIGLNIKQSINYDLKIFSNYYGLPNHFAKILYLSKGTSNCQGIDITFENDEYLIEPKGSLLISLNWASNLCLEKYPLLFLPRSRFAKLGLIIGSVNKKGILLFNASFTKIILGNRFLQILLPIPYIFSNGACNYIDHQLSDNMPVTFKDKRRKLKD